MPRRSPGCSQRTAPAAARRDPAQRVSSTTPPDTAASCATTTASSTASSSRRTPSTTSCAITEINSGTYVFAVAGLLRTSSPRVGHRQRAGREVPHRRRRRCSARPGSAVAAVPGPRPVDRRGHQRPRAARRAPRLELNAMIVRGWQLAGVTVHDPATTWIDLRATLAEDVELLPGTHISGATHDRARRAHRPARPPSLDCEVGENATVSRTRRDARGDRRRRIRRAVRLPAAGHRARRRRQDRHVRRDQERQDRRRQQGAAPQLHRRHDGRRGSNIGAGTITANYDGVDKHATVVGSHVRTGSAQRVRRAGHDRRRRVLGCRHGRSARTCRRARSRSTSRRSATWTAGSQAQPRRAPQAAEAAAASRAPRARRQPTRLESRAPRRKAERVRAIKITGQKRLVLVSGRAHPQLAEDIAAELDTELVHTDARTFANGEIYARFDESVRGCDAFVIQSHTAPDQRVAHGAADHDRCRSSAPVREAHHRRRPVLPVRPAGQEGPRPRADLGPPRRRPVQGGRRRPHHERRPARRADPGLLRRPRRPPVRDAGAARALPDEARRRRRSPSSRPDMGRVRVADIWSDKLGAPLAIIHKRRDPLVPNKVTVHEIVGEVEGRVCLLVDDMIDTGRTIVKAAEALKAHGATARRRRRDARGVLAPGDRDPAERVHRLGRRHRHPADPGGEALGPADRSCRSRR